MRDIYQKYRANITLNDDIKSIPGTINEKTRRNIISFTIKKWAGSPNQDKEIEKKEIGAIGIRKKNKCLYFL